MPEQERAEASALPGSLPFAIEGGWRSATRLVKTQYVLVEASRLLDNTLIFVCALLLCSMATMVFVEVLIRYVFDAPTAWTEETAQFMLVWFGLLAAAVGARKGLHFAIRSLVIHFDERTRWVIRQIVNLGVIAFLGALLVRGIAYLHVVADQVATGSGVNMRVPWGGIPAGIGAIMTMYVLDVADAALSIWTGRRFSVREAREEEIYRALRGNTAPTLSVEEPELRALD